MKNSNSPKEILTAIFFHLRQKGFELGIAELLAALEAIDKQQIKEEKPLRQMAKLVWCKSQAQRRNFDLIWQDLFGTLFSSSPIQKQLTPPLEMDTSKVSSATQHKPTIEQTSVTTNTESYIPDWKVLPICAPETSFLTEPDTKFELNSYWLLSRRAMANNWRYLRQPIADGPVDVLDIPTTIKHFSSKGFFLAPSYKRRKRNNAHLLLFIDQTGSMEPFHHFTHDLVETAYESNIHQLEVFYFHNVITSYVYKDIYRTKAIELSQILKGCNNNSSILILSDSGAARGHRRFNRIADTNEFLSLLNQITPLIAWLNPMPKNRWIDSSAEIISKLIQMFTMDSDGFSKAIDVIRGQ